MVTLADACFMAMAHEAYVRGIVEAYRAKVLREREYYVSKNNVDIASNEEGSRELITDIAYDFLMTDEDAVVYHGRCKEEQTKSGLPTLAPQNCPLLEAEQATREAQSALFDSISNIIGITAADCIASSYKTYLQLMDLILDLFANHVSDAQEILSRVMAARGSVAPTAQRQM